MVKVFKKFIKGKLLEVEMDSQLLSNFSKVLGFGFPVVFCLLFPFVFGIPTQWWACWVGLIALTLGQLCPQWLTYIYIVWMGFGEIMQRINAVIIFGLMFFVIITPIGFIFRIFGKDSLKKRWDSRNESYRTNFSADNPLERIKNTY